MSGSDFHLPYLDRHIQKRAVWRYKWPTIDTVGNDGVGVEDIYTPGRRKRNLPEQVGVLGGWGRE